MFVIDGHITSLSIRPTKFPGVINLYTVYGKERSHSEAVNGILFIHLEAFYMKSIQYTV
jgi:hypothetical protein